MNKYDVIIIGGGLAGIASSVAASKNNAKVLLIEREAKLGGILKQCIHDGFGLDRFNALLSGPEYASKEINTLKDTNVEVSLLTFVTHIEKKEEFILTLVSKEGIKKVITKSLILATGCRERTSKQINIQGTNPSGVLSAGCAQYYINILGKMPGKKFVILGSGDIGLIMARRITLEGGEVEGLYEIKSTPSGLTRNINQCLIDFNIPLHLSTTITKVFGKDRLTSVEVAAVDEKTNIIESSKRIIECDSLILSVGLIPENEIASKLHININASTKGPDVNQDLMTSLSGVFTCGNAMHVNDLADFVSESGEIAGKNASTYDPNTYNPNSNVKINIDSNFLYFVPNIINTSLIKDDTKNIFYFRSKEEYKNKTIKVLVNGVEIFKKRYAQLKPPEMEKIVLTLPKDLKEINVIMEK